MTIDEVIAQAREKADKNSACWAHCTSIRDCKKCEREHEQLAEWLEELKAYREIGLNPSMAKDLMKSEKRAHKIALENAEKLDAFAEEKKEIRNKAIDDFYNALAYDLIWIKERFGDDVYTDLWCSVGTRAEQLKAG